jgi:hypothetical protein
VLAVLRGPHLAWVDRLGAELCRRGRGRAQARPERQGEVSVPGGSSEAPGGWSPGRARGGVHVADDRLAALTAAGVSIWLDDLSRGRLVSGALRRLVDDKHVVGVTTNPAIFAAALARRGVYTPQTREPARRGATVGDAVRKPIAVAGRGWVREAKRDRAQRVSVRTVNVEEVHR